MQQLLPFPDLPQCPREEAAKKNWFPRLKVVVHQHDIYEPAGQATFADLSKFDPLLWATAYGDTADEREESYCQLRAHIGRKLGRYRKIKGKGFAAWVTVVCHNWKVGELRKRRPATTTIDDHTAETTPERCDPTEVDLAILFDDLSDELYIVYLWMRGDVGVNDRNSALKKLGFGKLEAERLVEEFRAIAAARLEICVPMAVDGKRSFQPSQSDS